jgi:CHASE3 domain sensor protein
MANVPKPMALWTFWTIATVLCLFVAGLVSLTAINHSNANAYERQSETLQQRIKEDSESVDRLISGMREHHFDVPTK